MTVDFGDGRVISRSMHGNVCSFICLADKTVVDVLPGIYGPRTYENAIEVIRKQALSLKEERKEDRADRLKKFHDGESKRILDEMNKMSLRRILGEYPMPASALEEPEVAALGEPAFCKGIIEDNAIAETTRRLITHEMLIKQGISDPATLSKGIYKHCLELDLDDPYLGLGPSLISNYPGESI